MFIVKDDDPDSPETLIVTKLKSIFPQESVRVFVLPSKFTVPLLWLNVPPEDEIFPEIFMFPDGAVNVPEEIVNPPFKSNRVLGAVNVPEEIVNPPKVSEVFVPTDKSPPLIVRNPLDVGWLGISVPVQPVPKLRFPVSLISGKVFATVHVMTEFDPSKSIVPLL